MNLIILNKKFKQIEKIIENREQMYKQKIKQLELQLIALKEQIDNERKRSREFRDRQFAGDVVRIGLKENYFNRLGNGGSGFNSVGGINSTSPFFRNENIDSIGYR